ncbi:pilus assembly protein CpaF, partial [Vibrio parahaemolyticus]
MFFKRKGVGSSFNSVDEEKESKVVKVDLAAKAEDEDYVSENKPLTPVEAKLKAIEEQKKQLEQDLAIKHYYHKKLLDTLDLGLLSHLQEDRAKEELREAVIQLIAEDQTHPLSSEARNRVIHQIEDEVFGLGPLEPLLEDPTISDILVNGPKNIYVERFGKLEKTPHTFLDERHLRNIIDRIVSQVGRRIDEASPMVDARLKDGSRFNAIIPPLAIDGPSVSIRR